mgnify:CR=1 FL=1|jgi:hypothetical protein
MITLSTGFGNGTITIVLLLFIILFMMLFQKKYIFKGLAFINKIMIPSMISKDLSKLKMHEKVILGYRYWVTKNSL